MLAKPQAIDSKVTMLGKAYLARCKRDLGNVFKCMGNQSSGMRQCSGKRCAAPILPCAAATPSAHGRATYLFMDALRSIKIL
ncbi:MAG: hypothetical protein RSD99_24055, partial [Janthinobacterium sp.]